MLQLDWSVINFLILFLILHPFFSHLVSVLLVVVGYQLLHETVDRRQGFLWLQSKKSVSRGNVDYALTDWHVVFSAVPDAQEEEVVVYRIDFAAKSKQKVFSRW